MNTEQQGLPQPQRNKAIIAIVLGLGMSILSGSMINLALPEIALDFERSFSEVIWVVSAYQAAALSILLLCSSLGDRIGYRRVYIGGVVLFTLGALCCAVTKSFDVLILMRVLQGIGSAGIMGVNVALMRQIYPEFLLGRGIALNGIVVSICAVSGPFFAAQLLTFGSWRWLFWFTLPIGGALFLLARNAFPGNAQNTRACLSKAAAIPMLDVCLNIVVFGLFFLVASYWRKHFNGVFQNTIFFVFFVLWCVLTYWYWKRQCRHPIPLLPVDLLRNKDFALSIAMAVVAYCAQSIFFLSLPFLMLNVWKVSETQSGLLIAVWPLAMALISIPVGWSIGRILDRLLNILGGVVLASGLGVLLLLNYEHLNYFHVIAGMVLGGFGFCLFQTSNVHSIISTAPMERSGAASGMMNVARLSGQILAALIVAATFARWSDLTVGVWVVQFVAFLLALFVILLGVLKLLNKPARGK